jgi:hypothetical protein
MKFLQNLKLDKWYGIILYLGLLLILASLLFEVKFLREIYASGFGLGLVMIGVSYFIGKKYVQYIKPMNFSPGYARSIWQIIKNNPFPIIFLFAGIGLLKLFGFLILKGLF